MRRVLPAPRLARAALTALVLLAAPRAQAQSPSDQMLAQSLFDQARELLDQGKFKEACPKLAESQRLDPGGGTLLNLAICHEKEGKLATAYTELNAALSQARKDGRKDREDIARERIAAVSPRVPKVTVHVASEVPGLEITLDGSSIRRPAWDVPTGVDPGAHVVEARALGYAPFRADVTVAEREQTTVTVPTLSPERVAPAPAAPPVAAPPAAPSRAPDHAETKPNPLYWGALSLGAVGMAVGTVAGIVWIDGLIRRSADCNTARGFCTEDGLRAADRERTGAWVSTVSFGVGLVAMGALIFIPRLKRVGIAPGPGGAVMSIALPDRF